LVAEIKTVWESCHPDAAKVKGKAGRRANFAPFRLDLVRSAVTMAKSDAEAPMTRLSIPDMNCGHCKAAVETALAAVPGTRDVAVDLAGRTVTVAGEAPLPALLAALNAAGYPAVVAAG
jgi:copper chaperone